METANLKQLIDQRLDLLDQALLGLLPRAERQEFIAQVESRVKAAQDAGTLITSDLPVPGGVLHGTAIASVSRPSRSGASRLSSLALLAGLSGIAALLLMFGMPITFIVGSAVAEAVGETGVLAAFGTHIFLIAIGGSAAVILGFISLVQLSRHADVLRGRGWAITALTTGALPMLIGGMLALTTTISVVASSTGNSPAVVAAPAIPAFPVGGPALPPPLCGDPSTNCRAVTWPAAPMVAPANQNPQPLPSLMPVENAAYAPAALPPVISKPEPAAAPAAPAAPAISESSAVEKAEAAPKE